MFFLQDTSQLFLTEEDGCHILTLLILPSDHRLNVRLSTSLFRVGKVLQKQIFVSSNLEYSWSLLKVIPSENIFQVTLGKILAEKFNMQKRCLPHPFILKRFHSERINKRANIFPSLTSFLPSLLPSFLPSFFLPSLLSPSFLKYL